MADLDRIVCIHLEAFRGFFLSALGPHFLRQLYLGFLREPSGICLLACETGGIVGFVAGTSQPEHFFRKLLLRRWYLFLATACGALVRHPIKIGARLLSALFYRGDRPASLPDGALLSSVAIMPDYSGRGVGKLLVQAFCQRAQQMGCHYVYLLTDRDQNDKANEFYLRAGFELESVVRKHKTRWMSRYLKHLTC